MKPNTPRVRFPDFHDGYDRLGMVYEARGDNRQAAQCYRQVIDFVRARPDQYEPGFEDTFHCSRSRSRSSNAMRAAPSMASGSAPELLSNMQ
jgi:hypothetical protein